jgi:hypothetical protein
MLFVFRMSRDEKDCDCDLDISMARWKYQEQESQMLIKVGSIWFCKDLSLPQNPVMLLDPFDCRKDLFKINPSSHHLW